MATRVPSLPHAPLPPPLPDARLDELASPKASRDTRTSPRASLDADGARRSAERSPARAAARAAAGAAAATVRTPPSASRGVAARALESSPSPSPDERAWRVADVRAAAALEERFVARSAALAAVAAAARAADEAEARAAAADADGGVDARTRAVLWHVAVEARAAASSAWAQRSSPARPPSATARRALPHGTPPAELAPHVARSARPSLVEKRRARFEAAEGRDARARCGSGARSAPALRAVATGVTMADQRMHVAATPSPPPHPSPLRRSSAPLPVGACDLRGSAGTTAHAGAAAGLSPRAECDRSLAAPSDGGRHAAMPTSTGGDRPEARRAPSPPLAPPRRASVASPPRARSTPARVEAARSPPPARARHARAFVQAMAACDALHPPPGRAQQPDARARSPPGRGAERDADGVGARHAERTRTRSPPRTTEWAGAAMSGVAATAARWVQATVAAADPRGGPPAPPARNCAASVGPTARSRDGARARSASPSARSSTPGAARGLAPRGQARHGRVVLSPNARRAAPASLAGGVSSPFPRAARDGARTASAPRARQHGVPPALCPAPRAQFVARAAPPAELHGGARRRATSAPARGAAADAPRGGGSPPRAPASLARRARTPPGRAREHVQPAVAAGLAAQLGGGVACAYPRAPARAHSPLGRLQDAPPPASPHVLRVGAALEARRLLAQPRLAASGTSGQQRALAGSPPRRSDDRSERVGALLARVRAADEHAAQPRAKRSGGASAHGRPAEARARARSASARGERRVIERPRGASAAARVRRALSPTSPDDLCAADDFADCAAQLGRLTTLARAVRLMRMHAYERELTIKLRVRDRRRRMRTTACS
ncbi:hypothetical protein KFE25_014377 [Diacronema lutheri]|uniref:Uncharacterized protein n=1 Tax=Diacronema lutheri TaxID=2081491 RepID=A0A8J5XFK1_DIALT|nr:hypothetical protein KFE25_014377 [Diacronema lutheri]